MGRAALVAMLMAAVMASCAGVFQRALPEQPATFFRHVDGQVLRVGAAERDITPEGTQYLGGFDLARTNTSVQAPVKARALVLLLGDLRVAVVGIDSLGVMREDVDWIKSGITGFANGCVFIAASHTHAAPDLIGLWGFYLLTSGRDRNYLARVRAGVAGAVADAVERAAPAELVLGEARLPSDGLVRNTNRSGVFDRTFTVLHACAVDDGRPLGTLLHFACHPEVLRRANRALSPDFVGPLCDLWRKRGHGQAVFVNGALGAMVTPEWRGHDVDSFGSRLCEIAEGGLAAARPLPVRELEVRRADVYLPLYSTGLLLGQLTTAIQRQAYDGHLRSTVGYLRIGEFEAVAVPGEMEPGLAQRIRARSLRPDLRVFGLVDDEVGYLMSEADARDPLFAYERTMCPCVDAGERVVEALVGR